MNILSCCVTKSQLLCTYWQVSLENFTLLRFIATVLQQMENHHEILKSNYCLCITKITQEDVSLYTSRGLCMIDKVKT